MIQPSHEDVLRFLGAATAAGEAWELDDPHSILSTDPTTGHQQVIGPFATAYEAVIGAQAMLDRAPRDFDGEEPYPTYKVVLSFTPTQSGL